MASTSTKFHIKNEKPSAQLSLLDNEEATSVTDVRQLSTGGTSPIQPPKERVFHGWTPPIVPPPRHPPREKVSPFRSIYNFFVIVILTVIFLLCLPILLIIYLLGGLLRLFMSVLLRCSNGGRFTLMKPSRTFGSSNVNHHTVMLVVRGRCDIDQIRDHMMTVINYMECVSGRRRFLFLQQRVATKFGYLCMEDQYARFNIKNHVKHLDIRRKNILIDSNDIIQTLESTYNDPFENEKTAPQWELLVVPRYSYSKTESTLLPPSDGARFHALIFRFHHGIMSWNMFQEMLVEFLGTTGGRVNSIFTPPIKTTCCTKLATALLTPFIGPATWIRQICTRWKRFAPLDAVNPKISLAMTKPMDCEAFDDIQIRTGTSFNTVLTSCVRMAARNMLLGQNLDVPRSLNITRIFNTMVCRVHGIDNFSVKYNLQRHCLERLHGSHHALMYQEGLALGCKRMFNKIVIQMAGVFPQTIPAWFYKNLLKGDVVVEIWPAADEPCKIFGGNVLADIIGWAGVSGIDADFKVTITTYCGRVRANFSGKQGNIEGRTDAHILASEFEEEFKKIASYAGLYQSRLFVSPAVELGM